MQKVFKIEGKKVGIGQPAFITAEIGLNHNGDPDLARKLIKTAADAGVDAVKFQIFKAETFISGKNGKAVNQEVRNSLEDSDMEMWKRLELAPEMVSSLKKYTGDLGMIFYASAFDSKSVDLLEDIGVQVFKVASGEVTNLPLIRKMAEKQHPIIMSVGMATLGEIERALNVVRESGNKNITLLHCVANYPTKIADVNLRRMKKLRHIFNLPVGYSDHTTSIWASIASAALGAVFIEKHFTLDKNQTGADHILSADPAEMKAIVEGVRCVESALGSDDLSLLEMEKDGRVLFRRGLVAAKSIPTGTVISHELVKAKRPAIGIEPSLIEIVIGRKARRGISVGSPITWDDI